MLAGFMLASFSLRNLGQHTPYLSSRYILLQRAACSKSDTLNNINNIFVINFIQLVQDNL